jgi:hypothetical protein
VVVTNGAKNITSSTFTLTTPGTSTAGFTCINAANQTITSGQALASPLAAAATITCSIRLVVNSTHQAAGKIAGFPVAASFTGGAGLYVAPLAATADVPVAAGAAASVPVASFPLANATAQNFIAGECLPLQCIHLYVCIGVMQLAAMLRGPALLSKTELAKLLSTKPRPHNWFNAEPLGCYKDTACHHLLQ